MTPKFESLILDSDELHENEWQHNPLHCSGTKTSKDEHLKVIITCLKRTFNYDFCIRVTAHPQGVSNVLKQKDVDDHHSLLRSLTDALKLYEVSPEPHLNTHQLDTEGGVIEYMELNFYWNNEAHTQLAHPDLALDKFSGTDPDQDAEPFIQLTKRKINCALGDAPGVVDNFRKLNFQEKSTVLCFSPSTSRWVVWE